MQMEYWYIGSSHKMLLGVSVYCLCTTMVAVYWTSDLIAYKLMELTAIWLCLVITSSRKFFCTKSLVEKYAMLVKEAFKILFSGSFSPKGYPTTFEGHYFAKRIW